MTVKLWGKCCLVIQLNYKQEYDTNVTVISIIDVFNNIGQTHVITLLDFKYLEYIIISIIDVFNNIGQTHVITLLDFKYVECIM